MATMPRLLLRRLPLLLSRRHHLAVISTSAPPPFRLPWSPTSTATNAPLPSFASAFSTSSSLSESETEGSDSLEKWEEIKEEILSEIQPIISVVRNILHSDKYMNGDHLTDEDEKVVLEKLLKYHPRAEEKIGCGLDSIIVDFHPQFTSSRCMFVVRTDGRGIDFSYRKCLRSYIRQKGLGYETRCLMLAKLCGIIQFSSYVLTATDLEAKRLRVGEPTWVFLWEPHQIEQT